MALRKRKPRPAKFQWPIKKIVQSVAFSGALALIIFGLCQFHQGGYFPIKTVKIVGTRFVNHQQIVQMITPVVQKDFFAIRVGRIRERLLRLPWVASASVWRVWPDKVFVKISERQPIARWNTNALLSNNGEVFSPDVESYPPGLPNFIGPDSEQIQMLSYYREINKQLASLSLKVDRFELTTFKSWRVTLSNGIKLNIGYKDILTRFHHFVKVYSKIIGNHASDVECIDLRYPNGLAVQWKSVT